jgi:hypothetical protein
MTEGDIFQARQRGEVLQQAEILAMRAIGDNVAAQTKALEALTNTVASMGHSLTDVRERVIRIEAQEATAKVKELGAEVDAYRASVETRIGSVERALARYQGMVVPGAIVLSAVLATFARYIAEQMFS